MNAKPVLLGCFVPPALRTQIKTIAAMQQTTVRALLLAEIERIAQRAQTQPGNSNETN